MGRQVQGPLRPGLGRAAGGDLRPPEGARGHPRGRTADRAARGDPGLVIYIIGDNGASAEGTLQATFNEIITLSGMGQLETTEYLLERLDKFGGTEAYNHYAVGWAHAMCTPYQWTKQVASHWGGTRNGTIVHWPGGIQASGELRHQFTHVIDVAPTLLEVAGLPQPASKHRTPWQTTDEVGIAFDDDVWELYDGASDWTQARNQAAERPDRLRELQRLFLIEATRYNVLPLDDRGFERATPETAGRPALIQGTSQVLFDGMGGLNEHCVVNVRNKSHSVTAELVVPDDGADGVLINQGGIAAGWALYVNDGRLRYCYNYFNLERTAVTAEQPLPAGAHQVRMEFAYDGGGVGKGGTVTLYLDGSPIGAGRLPRTVPIGFSADETTDVGRDTGSPVSDDYPATGNDFTGTINWVRIDLGDDSHDHQIDPAQLLHLAMARQ